ncbi:hypothetical protein BMS3Bbin15_01102 [archaeon BMS3Bbin15]|nr:hypothetical protein BMS3Bbin15_01102 [archaeon BMS3Bbin15]
MEALACGKPIVGIPIKNYPERYGNLAGVERLGLGRTLDVDWLIEQAISVAMDEVMCERYYRKAGIFRGFAGAMSGVKRAVALIENGGK